jgi:PAS domain S-box-containing protein/excisionase family DNA binding protein
MPEEKLEYSIQEVAEKLGIPIQKLRRWDAQGVLVARRTEGGHRRYPKDMVDGLAASLPGQSDAHDDELGQAREALRERRRLVQLLRETETRYRDLIETSLDIVWSADARGCLTQFAGGAARVFPQTDPVTVLGRSWRSFEDPAARWLNRRFTARLRRDGDVRGMTLVIRDAAGQRRWLQVNARLLRDHSGAIQGARGTAQDVTDRRLGEARRHQLETHDALTGPDNRTQGLAPPVHDSGSGRQDWGRRLREVLRRDGLRLYVQPVVRVDDGSPVHYEVLVRAEASDGSLLSPEEFIGPAETLGLVQEIDLAVIRKLLEWLDTPERREVRCRFFVNVSAVSISDPAWLLRFQTLLDGSGFTPGQVVFELSEAGAMAHMPASQAFARDIKRRGCRLAIDDFGAGFGSFQSLRDLPVDYVNIDGGFIRHMGEDESGAILLRALGDVARGLSRQVIAKWVETPEVLARLGALDLHYAQGFLFGRPVPIDSPLPGGRYFPSPGQAAPH